MGEVVRDVMAGVPCWSLAFPGCPGAESEPSSGDGKAGNQLTGLCRISEGSVCGQSGSSRGSPLVGLFSLRTVSQPEYPTQTTWLIVSCIWLLLALASLGLCYLDSLP